jgi:TetR/AcrR family transcriptional regulator, lmrAB and yxaGH operons repressor
MHRLDRPVYSDMIAHMVSSNPSSSSVSLVANAAPTPAATRERILMAALKLFRQRGYHATGLAEILALAESPKGSLYHHFPGGKEEIAVAVVELITAGVLQAFDGPSTQATRVRLKRAGESLAKTMEKTRFELCALYTGFAVESRHSPLLAAAVAKAYGTLVESLSTWLKQDGISAARAHKTATLIVSLLEGGAVLSQAKLDAEPFRIALAAALDICKADAPKRTRPAS